MGQAHFVKITCTNHKDYVKEMLDQNQKYDQQFNTALSHGYT